MQEPFWRFAHIGLDRLEALREAAGVTRPTALVLAALGIDPGDACAFLRPALRDLVDPFRLPGTEAAAARLWDAIRRNESILIHGDYDTDGITAAVLMASVLRQNGACVDCFLPHRIDDGYGLTVDSLQKARRKDHRLLVTVDCGVTSAEAIEAAAASGLDVIVTDHHEPGDVRLDPRSAVVIDPKLPGSPRQLSGLAGVGVAFKVCHAFLKYARANGLQDAGVDLREVLDLVALGTVADIVSLTGENRRLVRFGLEALSRQCRPGVRALCEIARIGDGLTPCDVAFRLAPRLNAAGRMGAPEIAMALLQASSMVEAQPLAADLDRMNRERQQIEEEVFCAAEACIAREIDVSEARSIVVWGDDWHTGVIGIVASRITRQYHRPAIVLTREAEGLYSGSARSIPRVDLVAVLAECAHRLVRYGGHAMAAGLALPPEELEGFRRDFENAIGTVIGRDALRPRIEVLGWVGFDEITDGFFAERTMLEPFGHGNPEPVFAASEVTPLRVQPVGQGHCRGTLRDSSGRSLGFIAFRRTVESLPPPPWDVAYSPQINRFGGRERPQARIEAVRSSR